MGLFGDIAKSVAGPLVGGLFDTVSKPKADYKGAKNQVTWRVQDAKRAGVHPLAALGLPSMGPVVSQSNMAPWAADAASNVAQVLSTREQAAMQKEMADAQLENMKLRNAEIAARIKAMGIEDMGQTPLGVVSVPRPKPLVDPNTGMTTGTPLVLPGGMIADVPAGIHTAGDAAEILGEMMDWSYVPLSVVDWLKNNSIFVPGRPPSPRSRSQYHSIDPYSP